MYIVCIIIPALIDDGTRAFLSNYSTQLREGERRSGRPVASRLSCVVCALPGLGGWMLTMGW